MKIKQHDITDCGAACLASVAGHYELKLPIAKIREYASTDQRGTNILGMVEAAEKLGFVAKGIKCKNEKGENDFAPLLKVPTPFIAHVLLKNQLQHFVVVYKVSEKKITVMDPGLGDMVHYSQEELLKIWTGNLILLLPDDSFSTGDFKVSMTQRFWFLLTPHKYSLIQSLVGTIIITLLGLAMSLYVQKIIDYVLPSGNKNLLNLLSVVVLAIFIVETYLSYAKSWLVARSGVLIDIRLILGYYQHLLKLPQSFFDSMRVGEIVSRINDAIKIRSFINEVSITFIVNVFIIIFSFAFLFFYSWKIALIMLVMIPLYFIIYIIYNQLNKNIERKMMEQGAELESHLVESLTIAGTIKRIGVEEFSNIKTEQLYMRLLDTSFKSFKNSVLVSSTTSLINHVFSVILLWVGAYYVMNQEITPGELFSLYAIVGYFTSPLASLVTMNKSIQSAKIAADRLFQIFDLNVEKKEEQKLSLSKEQLGDIVFKDVAFKYGSRADVFDNFSATIPYQKITAIIGESGSGKSTIAHLLQNMYALQKGKILIGGQDISLVDLGQLRKRLGIVPQNIDLFSGNMIENIAIGEFEPDMDKVMQISKELGIIDFVEKMPNGFLTYIGENGTLLSGGQKQRLAIARALYQNPDIFIFDEATSSLDAHAESLIGKVIAQLKQQGKTIIIIAHRLSTIKNADKILVLANGQLVQDGNHATLISQVGLYQALWNKQI